MKIDQPPSPPRAREGGATLRSRIGSCLTGDESCCLMCFDCGEVFLKSQPFQDESEADDNVTLSKRLWNHFCKSGIRAEDRRRNSGR